LLSTIDFNNFEKKFRNKKMTNYKLLSRMTGTGYLIIFITGFFANFGVVESLIVKGDVTATVNNISTNITLFRWGMFSFILMVVIDTLLAWSLYLLFKPVNNNLSLLSGWLRLVNAGIFAVALYHLFNVLNLVTADFYQPALDNTNYKFMIMLSLDSFNFIWLIGLIFFGIHLLILGYLILKSTYIPKYIGILLLLASVGYLIDSFAVVLMPNYVEYKDIFQMVVIIPGVLGELSLTLKLLIWGVDEKKFQAQTIN